MSDFQHIASLPRPVTPLSITASKLWQLQQLARRLGYSDPEFNLLIDDTLAIAAGLDPYVKAFTTAHSGDLEALENATRREDWRARFSQCETTLPLEQEMLSGQLEGQFLKTLIYATRALHVLEIGLFSGYSALAMAEALPENGKLVACEIDGYAAEFARSQFAKSQHGHKISVEIAPAMDTLERLITAGIQFDFVFIDADKSNYWNYLDRLITGGLLTDNALICVDNTLFQGQPYLPSAPTENGRAIAEFNENVLRDCRIEQVMLPIRDGVTLIRCL